MLNRNNKDKTTYKTYKKQEIQKTWKTKDTIKEKQ